MYRSRLIGGLAAATVSLGATPAALAERIAPITVTATRTAQTADESLASVTVIDREEIERSQSTGMTELLGRQPGVEFTRNGGRGTNASIFLRGTESDHVLVLIDGVEIGSATTGTAAFEDLPLANVERIEIVRGPRSSLYGSGAIGGVIQIFTRGGEGPHASAGIGSNDRRNGSAGYGIKSGGTSFSVNVAAEETDGIDARENDCTFCADEPDDDGYENQSVNVRASQDISDAVTISGSLLAADSEVEYDGNFQNRTEGEQRVYAAQVDARPTDNWDARFQVSRSEDNSDNFLDRQRANTFDTTRDAFSWQNTVTLGSTQIVSLGVDAKSTNIDSNLAFAEDERDTVGAYAQHQWTGGDWNTEISLRGEDYDDFEDPTTGSFAVGYRFTGGLQAFASYATAFRAPTFNELYFPGFGNADLEPEESRTIEAGLRGRHEALRWETTVYRTEVDQLIATTSAGGRFFPDNIEEARIQGIEVIVGVTTDEWDGNISLDLKDAENTETGNELPRRAGIGIKGGLTRDFGAWSVGSDVTVQGERFDDTANTTPLDAYALIDLRARWDLARDWTARLKIENLADTDYTLADTYNTRGRTVMAEIAWHPNSTD
ncbi:MAG: TonB-dependent receptor [Halofilum sp. (in: g-proteobacteria)]|nr:TonB-dependent receptor [Halofilum sp. (in: g-proteobacteria)]